MSKLFTEVIGGKTYEVHRGPDGSKFHVPPLPPEEVAKRQERDPAFQQELLRGQIARGETDSTYLAGMPHFSQVFGEAYANEVRAVWDRMGVEYTANTNYCPHLAEFQGDPRAIVDGRSPAKKRQERLNAPVIDDPYDKPPTLAPELIQENAEHFVSTNPDEARKMSARDLKDHMVEKHAPKL